MQSTPAPVLVLHGDRELVEMTQAVAKSHGEKIRAFGSWEDLLKAVPRSFGGAVVLVDPYWGSDTGLSECLEDLLARHPSLPVVAALTVHADLTRDLIRLGKWGVVQILDLSEERNFATVTFRVRESRCVPLRRVIADALPESLSGMAHAIIATTIGVVIEGGQGSDIADRLKVTPRTLSRWNRRVDLPPPKQLTAWIRILWACSLLDDANRSVDVIAESCGYAGSSSLRLALRRYLGRTPSELRETGALHYSLEGFLSTLREAKSSRKLYRRKHIFPKLEKTSH